MKAQMQTLTLAGHETTANTVSWLLWELAKHPDYQAKLRAEIRAGRQKMLDRGEIRFTTEDLDNMPLLNNAIKVCHDLRLTLSYSLTCTTKSRLHVGDPAVSPHCLQHFP